MELQRRTALKGGAAAVAGALTGGPFAGLLAPAGAAAPQAPHRRLRAIPDLRDGQVRLHLPEGFSYRSFHDTEFPVVLDDGTSLPGRHDGMGAFRRARRQLPAGPQPRGHQLGHRDRVRARHAVRRQGRRRHDHDRGDQVRRGRQRLHQPQRHDVQLQRRRDAVGFVDHLRGDHQRSRRRARTSRGSRTPSSSRSTATSSRCRPTARATGSRSPGPGASRTRPCRSTRSTGSCTSPRTTSSSPPASTATSPRTTPWRPGTSTTRAGSRCSRSPASRTPTSRRGSRSGRRTASGGSTSTTPTRRWRRAPPTTRPS